MIFDKRCDYSYIILQIAVFRFWVPGLTADLHEACETVPAGILELINLQQEGFAYVKP